MAEATYYGTGRRKTSVARVRLVAGQGNIVINGRVLDDYFDLKTLEIIVKQPLELTGTTAVYDVIASVKGGGASDRPAPSVMVSAAHCWKLIRNIERFLRAQVF